MQILETLKYSFPFKKKPLFCFVCLGLEQKVVSPIFYGMRNPEKKSISKLHVICLLYNITVSYMTLLICHNII